MLTTLKRIVQEVNSAADLGSALTILVSRVQAAMGTEVCSIYLFNPESRRYVLMATKGLNAEAVGRVSLAPNEGVVGLVAQREEPINLDDASSHPRYLYLSETGEEVYNSFLGVPIIHHRRILGVLVVQQRAKRKFDESEEAFMVTMSAQLAAVLAHAEASGQVLGFDQTSQSNTKPARDVLVPGVPGSPGVAIGKVVVISHKADLYGVPDKTIKDSAEEVRRFQAAIDGARSQIRKVGEALADLRPEERALFDVYIRMLDDDALGNEVIRRIEEHKQWAQGALRDVILGYVAHFERMDDAYLRERATDIKDLGARVLAQLQESVELAPEFPENTILVSDELTPAMLGEVPESKLKGLVSVKGSANSHVAILARAMGIPAVMGAIDLPVKQLDGLQMVVDGYRGRLFTHPSKRLRTQFQAIVEEEKAFVKGFEALKDLPAQTTDGHRIRLMVNTGLITDAVRSKDRGAEGVGLYRTEIPFMMGERFPSETEQANIYRQQLETFAPNPVTMRTLDIGGDKSLPYFPIEEENPFLGWRGIRVTLDHPEIFLLQVRAMLKASIGLNNLQIMLPMITTISEVEEAQHLIYRAYQEVRNDGFDVQMPKIGVMIEVPAAVYLARQLAQMVDFLSVGSNDLTQYLLAVDRNNPRVADLYDAFHPAVLNALQRIVNDGHQEGKPVSVCGEMASHPSGALLLMAMGFDSLSMNATNLPRVKSVLRAIDMPWAKALLEEVMGIDNPQIIASMVELALERRGMGRFIRPGS
ncbi:MAG: phosphoenolpyruvate--protein phosphotransferase [Oceanospirillaceae bacterium]|nr:phosphoenolpyruvate--protein phosphotransferase [Oceanospirillaceae bacterium]MCP5350454.1 phosphoenolpyruvate--protein phosphotransferase [Oceanospirillaceae bacterium]